MKNQKGFALIGILFVLLWVAAAAGYIMNIVKITQLDFQEPYKAEVIRVAGILPPVGAIVGYLTIKDE